MNDIYEALKGFSDIPIMVIALLFYLMANRVERQKEYAKLFLIIAVCSFLGATVHILDFPGILTKLIWVVLYYALFEASYSFALLFSKYINHSLKLDIKKLKILKLTLWGGSIISFLAIDKYDMLFLIGFAVICLIIIIKSMIETEYIPRKAILLLALLILVILLLGFRNMIPYGVVFVHLIIMAVLLDIYLISKG